MSRLDPIRVWARGCGVLAVSWLLMIGGITGCSDGGSGGNDNNDGGTDAPADMQDDSDGDAGDDGDADSEGGSSGNDIGSNDPNTLAAIGDSITAGSEVSGPSYPARLQGILGKRVLNRGVAGATSAAAGGHAASALGAKPSYLLMMYGTNDVFREIPSSTVAANVQTAVRAAKTNRTIPVVATIPPNLRSDFQNGLVASINSRLKAMASSEGVRVADVNREFGSGEGLIQSDGFHPNETGTQIIAFAFADAVR